MKKQWDVTVYIHGLLMTTVKPIRTLALIIETVVCFQNVVSWNCSQPWYMLQKFHGWNGWKCSGMPRSRYFKLVSHDLRMWAFDLHFSRYFKLVIHGKPCNWGNLVQSLPWPIPFHRWHVDFPKDKIWYIGAKDFIEFRSGGWIYWRKRGHNYIVWFTIDPNSIPWENSQWFVLWGESNQFNLETNIHFHKTLS